MEVQPGNGTFFVCLGFLASVNVNLVGCISGISKQHVVG